MTIKLAHISDLHFSTPHYNPTQFFSKRWLGNLNLILFRKKRFIFDRLPSLLTLFQEKKIGHVLITGDFSTTSLKKEFILAQKFVKSLKDAGLQVITLPGNHDHYTKKEFKKKYFYSFFDSSFEQGSPYTLKEHGLAIKTLSSDWYLIALDTTAYPTLLSSQGYFSPELEKNLKEALASLKGKNIILANHFPFFQNEHFRKRLIRGNQLKTIFQEHPNIRFYLHGHTHRHCIADLRASSLPIVLDPGSVLDRNGSGCHMLEINSKGCNLEVFKWKDQWTQLEQHQFQW